MVIMKFCLLLVLQFVLLIESQADRSYLWSNLGTFQPAIGSRPIRRQVVLGSNPFILSPGNGSPYALFRPKTPRYFFWNTESFHKWTNWTGCRSSSCKRFRYRKCRRGRKCPTQFLIEMKECSEAPGCREETFNETLLENIANSTCGIRPELNLKIMGGKASDPHSWPWQAAMIMSQKRNALPSCGATLIGSRWVVTAAHCLVVNSWPTRLPIGTPFRPRRNHVRLRLGDHHMHFHDSHEKTYDAKLILIHPNFKLSLRSCQNDIALIMLNETVPLHNNVNVACLPTRRLTLPSKTMCKALGWGIKGYAPPRRTFFDWLRPKQPLRPEVLQEVDIPLISYKQCMREYPEYALNATSHLCAGAYGKDTCKGDSGGPLLCPVKVNGTERWFLYGVTSFGSQNGCGKGLGVYSKVSYFSQWIKKTKESLMQVKFI